MALKTCPGYTSDGSSGETYSQTRHALENSVDNFGPGKSQCRDCYRAYAHDWQAKRPGTGGTTARRGARGRGPTIVMPNFSAPALASAGDGEFVSDEDLASSRSHAYRPGAELIETWGAVANSAADGSHPFNLMFLGPSGCGKTEGAKFLAALVGLPFTKVDAASMTDPEAWFGTREVIESEGGVSVTSYRPSAFVMSIEEPGVLLLDEINRVGDNHRNILLPLLDGTHQVTNPLTGDIVTKHPHCFIIMSGNRGLNFTGTYAVDPALMSRSLVLDFDYASQPDEVQIAMESSGCDQETAELFVRFATDSRAKAKADPDFNPISTREVMAACKLSAKGMSLDSAARVVVINAASPEGGPSSIRASLETLWTGIRANPSAPSVRACGAEHPYITNDAGDPVTCVVEVPLADPRHLGAPQHKGPEVDGRSTVTWFDQP